MTGIIRMLTAATAAGGLALVGLVTAGAASASTPGTTGVGGWSFDPGDGSNAISTTTSAPTVSYSAQVQQPVNNAGPTLSNGGSIFSAKSRTIPLKYQVQKCTTPGASSTNYPDTLTSLNGASYPGVGSYGNLSLSVPPGTTVSQVSNLTANFTWLSGHDGAGSLRWQITTPDGQVFIYYGDPPSFNSEAGLPGNAYSGANMIAQATDARTEGFDGFNATGTEPEYDTLLNMLSRPAPHGTIAQEPVTGISLVVDSGYTDPVGQKVHLSSVQITDNAGTSTYTPGTVTSGGGPQTCATDNSAPAYVYLNEVSGATPGQVPDESLDSTQGDTGGQFRQVDGMYIYNFPVANLPDKSATYQFGIEVGSSTAVPAGVTAFGVK